MKTKVHKGLSWLLSLCMVAMLLPMSALAVDEDTTAPTITGVALYSDNECTQAIVSGDSSTLSTTTTSTIVKKIVVTMSENVTLSGGTDVMVKFGDAEATAYGSIAVDENNPAKLIITPANDWGIDYVGTMKFTLGSGVVVKDSAENLLASDAAITLTVAAADTTAPTITGVALYSDNECTQAIVSGDSSTLSTTTTSTIVKKIVVTMSENVTLSGGTDVMVKFGDAEATAFGSIAVDESNPAKLIITPANDWGIDYVGTMKFTLGSGVVVKDSAENPLASDAAITLVVETPATPDNIASLTISVSTNGTISGDTDTGTVGASFSYYLVSASKQSVIDTWNVETSADGIAAALEVSTQNGEKPTLSFNDNSKYLVVVETKDGKAVAAGQSAVIDIDSPYTITEISTEAAGGAGKTRTISTSGIDGNQYLVVQITEGAGADAHVSVVMVKAEDSATISYKTTATVQAWLTDGMPTLSGSTATGATIYDTASSN